MARPGRDGSSRPAVVVAVIAFALMTSGAVAQEEAPGPSTAIVRTTANLRARANRASEILGTVPGGSFVAVIGSHDGWRRIKAADGRFGWIAGDLLDPAELSLEGFMAVRGAGDDCNVRNIDDCPAVGCADTDQKVLLHTRKRRVVRGRPIPLAMQDFLDLQEEAEETISQGATVFKEDMPKLRKMLRRDGGDLGEGMTVEFFGYIVGEPDSTGAENVNCNLTGAGNVDFHINIADAPRRTPYKSIVVEMIPQDRPDGWTTKKLRKIARTHLPVRVIGQLFYDNKHFVRDRKTADERTKQSKRHSLWEIHPVTKFFVCAEGGCEPRDREGWVPLEDWAE